MASKLGAAKSIAPCELVKRRSQAKSMLGSKYQYVSRPLIFIHMQITGHVLTWVLKKCHACFYMLVDFCFGRWCTLYNASY